MASLVSQSQQLQLVDIAPENELRCEARSRVKLTLKLVDGVAEIFGIEMTPGKEYVFVDENLAVFTWYGAKVEVKVEGDVDMSTFVYVIGSTMVQYLNTHIQLEARRDVALANQDFGPRVVVVGEKDQGKSTLCRVLCAYAARIDRAPIMVDLDVSHGALSVPGTIGAVQVEKATMSIEEGILHNAMPLVYYYGSSTPSDNLELYKRNIDVLASKVKERMNKDIDAKTSGCIVNTCGWVDGKDARDGKDAYETILHVINAMEADVVLVINHDRLFAALSPALAGHATIVRLDPSRGVQKRDAMKRKEERKNRITEYFHGRVRVNPEAVIASSRQNIQLHNCKFFQASLVKLSEGMRGVGDSSSRSLIMPVSPTKSLQGCLLAVIHAPEDQSSIDGNFILRSNVAGFVAVIDIFPEDNKIIILSPYQGALPSLLFLIGTLKFEF